MRAYVALTAPVVEHYRELGRFAEVDGDRPIAVNRGRNCCRRRAVARIAQPSGGFVRVVQQLQVSCYQGKARKARLITGSTADDAESWLNVAVVLKSSQEIEKMRRAGRVVREVLELVRSQVKPGATTLDLEKAAEARLDELGVKAAFKGYHGFPCVLCTSVNSEVVHGIPSPKRVLKEGDIVSVDFGVVVDGYLRRRGHYGAGGRDRSRKRGAAAAR